ncbi:MAG: SDR family NAD(P)-dependent oxidoreductase [Sandarakinorhabdus sp.]|nr:SDR family NAD(P)-dependent oxidoreductase [Sandarakinorhabdus sp.]
MELAGKTVWVTGASSGIGRGLALALASEGARLILSGRNVEALGDVAAACPGASVLAFDATDLDALPAIVARAQAITGHIDLLVNNAGIGARGLARDTVFDVYRRVMEVDFFAPLRLTQLVLPAMRARGTGHLAVVSSLSGKFGNPGATAYCSAKFALIGYFDALRSEVAHEGIGVTVITPGFVKTNIAAHSLNADGLPHGPSAGSFDRGITAEESAEQIITGFKAGQREIPVGRGPEMALLDLKRSDPDQVFDMMAAMGAQMAASA